MTDETFRGFRELIYARSGITLGDHKKALVSARVGKRLRALGLSDPAQYLECVRHDDSGQELIQLIDHISTNVTSFYREPVHFEVLSQHLSALREKGQRRFRIWCAAASTGEEPYTIAITAREALGKDCDLRILATDISTRVLRTCVEGVYGEQKVATVPGALLHRYFERARENGAVNWRVCEELRALIAFRRLNLAEPPFPMRGPFDAVLCRNVMIYFDDRVRRGLLGEVHRVLAPGGFLMIGHAETLTGLNLPFKPVQPAVYMR